MLVPISWLKEFIPVADDAAEIERKLTMLGLEVEGAAEKSGETVFDIKLTANKADSLSVFGISRELGLVSDKSLKQPAPSVDKFPKSSLKAEIEIRDPDLCPRYSGLIIEAVKVKPSPDRIVRRLEQCGIRAINDIVDATNYGLLELGHPLHAFDLNLLDGKKIVVRRAAANEVLTTLDGVKRTLIPDNLVIADAKKAVALAGIMGGSNSEINDSTTTILLESAYFDPVSVRKTGRKLGLHTEASHRFERGADYGGTVRALLRCAEIILELNPSAKVSAVTDVYPVHVKRREIVYRNARYAKIIGAAVPFKDAASIIRKTGCVVSEDAANESLSAEPPSYRPDLEREIDLIEEVARVTGYDKIPVFIPSVAPISSELFDGFKKEFDMFKHLRTILSSAGLNETVNYSFESAEFNDKLGLPSSGRVPVLNPLDQNQGTMRMSLVPGLLSTLQRNGRFLNHDMGLFELGSVFISDSGKIVQENRLAIALSGLKSVKKAHQEEISWDWFDLKGFVEFCLSGFEPVQASFRKPVLPQAFLHKGRTAEILIGSTPAGYLGELSYLKVQELELKGPVFVAELSLAPLAEKGLRKMKFAALEKLLPVHRDLSLLVPKETGSAKVEEFIRSREFVAGVSLKDIYENEKIGAANAGLTFTVTLLQNPSKPLSDSEINGRMAELVKGLEKIGLKQR